jgi:hypothetical protein
MHVCVLQCQLVIAFVNAPADHLAKLFQRYARTIINGGALCTVHLPTYRTPCARATVRHRRGHARDREPRHSKVPVAIQEVCDHINRVYGYSSSVAVASLRQRAGGSTGREGEQYAALC